MLAIVAFIDLCSSVNLLNRFNNSLFGMPISRDSVIKPAIPEIASHALSACAEVHMVESIAIEKSIDHDIFLTPKINLSNGLIKCVQFIRKSLSSAQGRGL